LIFNVVDVVTGGGSIFDVVVVFADIYVDVIEIIVILYIVVVDGGGDIFCCCSCCCCC